MKISILVLLVLLSLNSFSQDPDKDRAYLLQKSKKTETAAWICLGTGIVTITTGLLIPKGNMINEGFWFVFAEYENSDTKTAFALAGSLISVSSLFLFGRATSLERRALRVSIKNESSSALLKNSMTSINVPSVTLKLTL